MVRAWAPAWASRRTCSPQAAASRKAMPKNLGSKEPARQRQGMGRNRFLAHMLGALPSDIYGPQRSRQLLRVSLSHPAMDHLLESAAGEAPQQQPRQHDILSLTRLHPPQRPRAQVGFHVTILRSHRPFPRQVAFPSTTSDTFPTPTFKKVGATTQILPQNAIPRTHLGCRLQLAHMGWMYQSSTNNGTPLCQLARALVVPPATGRSLRGVGNAG